MKYLIDAGVAGIITDHPDILAGLLGLKECDTVKKVWLLCFGFSASALRGACITRLFLFSWKSMCTV
jgi:hypothetical protein